MTPFTTQRCRALMLFMLAGASAACAEAIDGAPVNPEASATQRLISTGPADQFAGGFHPSNAPDGGFGGGNCAAVRTPVIFVHGNTVNATFFAKPSTSGAPSGYDTLKAAGYNDCELFGITYLSPSEQASEPLDYHTPTKAARTRDFINAVKAYTGNPTVNIRCHSVGVTVPRHGITFSNLWSSIDTVVNVAGGLRGLSSCLAVGYANPAFPTCGSQNVFDPNIFGFWPDGAAGASNPRTGTSASVGFRREPERRPDVRFFTISGGVEDTKVGGDQCKFNAAAALKAQLDVDIDHLSTFSDTGAIMTTMLTTTCTGTGCCAGYSASCINL